MAITQACPLPASAAEGTDESPALFGGHRPQGEQLLELVDHDDQPGRRRSVGAGVECVALGGAAEGHGDRDRGVFGVRGEHPAELLGVDAHGLELDKRPLGQDGRGEPAEQGAGGVARAELAPPPRAGALDDSRPRDRRHHAGADQRRLAAAAHAEDEKRRAAGLRPPHQSLADRADRARPAVEDRRVLDAERVQPQEGGAQRPVDRRAEVVLRLPAFLQPVQEVVVQVVLDPVLELVDPLVRLERGLEGAVFVEKPPGDERLEGPVLRLPLGDDRLVLEAHLRHLGPPVDEQVGRTRSRYDRAASSNSHSVPEP